MGKTTKLECKHINAIKHGTTLGRIKIKRQRFRCKDCNETFSRELVLDDQNAIKRKILFLYLEGFSFKQIGKILNTEDYRIENEVNSIKRLINAGKFSSLKIENQQLEVRKFSEFQENKGIVVFINENQIDFYESNIQVDKINLTGLI